MNEFNKGSLEKINLDDHNLSKNKSENSDLYKNNVEDKENLSASVCRKDNKTSDIYERFINRIQGISESNVDKDSSRANLKEKLPHAETASEPLDNAEWQLSLETEQTSHNDQKIKAQQLVTSKANTENTDDGLELSLLSPHEDPTLDDAATASVLPTDLKADANIQQTGVSEDKQIGSLKLKLLIIGIVCGLLLSALVIAILTMTGIFTNTEPATESPNTTVVSADGPDTASIKTLSSEETVAKSDDVSDVSEANLSDNVATVGELSVDKPIDKSTLSDEQIKDTRSKTSTTQLVTAVSPKTDTNDTEADLVKNSDNEATISYEDFAEEAQSTLYRETNN
ncbi:hypothetical protein AAIR29_04520 [Psychrobacter sp. FBL11]|uniref:Uncharacterized protein n=1 Tax=Psychrobacter saeujeotis TaxID=3143436 RepID=A0ABU9X6R4_9GAMM|nr:hypothetical protein [uncultured Psychrobacter sp.]